MFDADAFQNAVITDANSTRTIPWPQGEYPATIRKVQVRSGTVQKQGDNYGKPWAALSIQVEVDRSLLPDGASNTAFGSIMLDLTDSGGLDTRPGRNISLGRLREAVGLNVPGQPFSFTMLEGRSCKIATGVRTDQNDPEIQYTDVKAFKAL